MATTAPLLASEVRIETVQFPDARGQRQTWYAATARGFTTGWCVKIGSAMTRIVAWFDDQEISESPAGQASREEMQAASAWMEQPAHRPRGNAPYVVAQALASTYDGAEWIAGTHEVLRCRAEGMPMPAGRKIRR
jgi:hypothetical protein